ncbi:hypothetical protein D3C86_1796240 [compost metagenome]
MHSFGDQFDLTMFENLFFSGVYDSIGGLTNFSFGLMGLGSIFLMIQTLILYLISRNKHIALLPFGLSIVLTVTHMAIFRLYVLIGSSIPSPVYFGYERFAEGDSARVLDIAFKLLVSLLLFMVIAMIEKYSPQPKKRTA